jgi:predicted metal-dependent hydrolase
MDFSYTIKSSQRAKHISIKITQDKDVVLTLPRGVSKSFGLDFLKKKTLWIRKNLEQNKSETKRYECKNGEELPLLGKKIKLIITEKNLQYPKVKQIDDYLIVFCRGNSDKQEIHHAIINHYKKSLEILSRNSQRLIQISLS